MQMMMVLGGNQYYLVNGTQPLRKPCHGGTNNDPGDNEIRRRSKRFPIERDGV